MCGLTNAPERLRATINDVLRDLLKNGNATATIGVTASGRYSWGSPKAPRISHGQRGSVR
ncbi:hypothetical protein EYF80_039714 [Liparis tanakae]|uniref:Uncharacterized protein n=1 Tax=Liparis tanakae TaxID=230148 RepID=A0A4Z2G9C4_9TELE|nr:hypothetical protein EYF80_039714 [Liparis tanakae]